MDNIQALQKLINLHALESHINPELVQIDQDPDNKEQAPNSEYINSLPSILNHNDPQEFWYSLESGLIISLSDPRLLKNYPDTPNAVRKQKPNIEIGNLKIYIQD